MPDSPNSQSKRAPETYFLVEQARIRKHAAFVARANSDSVRATFARELPRGYAPSTPLTRLAAVQLTEHIAAPPEGRSHLSPEVIRHLLELCAWLEHRAAACADVVEHIVQGVTPPADMVERAYAGGREGPERCTRCGYRNPPADHIQRCPNDR